MIECPLLTVDFFSKYLLSSVEIWTENYFQKYKNFFIKIMSHYKENPIFRENDIHKTLIQQMMKQINPVLTTKEEEPFYEAKNLYKLFFSSITLIIKQQQHDHWELILSNFKKFEQHKNQESFGSNTTLKNFTLSLPIQNKMEHGKQYLLLDILKISYKEKNY
jgi:hypothetical protein